MNPVLINLAAVSVLIWGIAHLFPTKSVVNGFGDISADNKNILLMEWLNEGLTLIFIGLLLLAVVHFGDLNAVTSHLVLWASSLMLFGMAILSLLTGFKVNILPFKLCPFIFTGSGILILFGIYL